MSEDEADLPEMRSAILSDRELDALFEDIGACAQVRSVRLKTSGRQAADEAPLSLDDARSLLRSGLAHGVQIRYIHQGREYFDTLLKTDDGFRLVRM